MIHCHLNYLCILWGSAAVCHLKPLQVLQNRAIKSIYNFPIQYPSSELYNVTKILPIKGLYCHQTCLFVKSTICNRNYSTITFNYVAHEHNTRSQNVLDYYTSRTNFGKTKISYIGPKLFNDVPTEFLGLNYELFKYKLKFWLLEKPQIDKLSKLYFFRSL